MTITKQRSLARESGLVQSDFSLTNLIVCMSNGIRHSMQNFKEVYVLIYNCKQGILDKLHGVDSNASIC